MGGRIVVAALLGAALAACAHSQGGPRAAEQTSRSTDQCASVSTSALAPDAGTILGAASAQTTGVISRVGVADPSAGPAAHSINVLSGENACGRVWWVSVEMSVAPSARQSQPDTKTSGSPVLAENEISNLWLAPDAASSSAAEKAGNNGESEENARDHEEHEQSLHHEPDDAERYPHQNEKQDERQHGEWSFRQRRARRRSPPAPGM